MAKWGPWARACFVLYWLAVAIIPIVLWIDVIGDAAKRNRVYYDDCVKAAGPDYSKWDGCWKDFMDYPKIEFWPFWSEAALWTAIGAAIVWALLWSAGLTIRWILAGRKNNS